LPATEGSTNFLVAKIHAMPNDALPKPQIMTVYLRRLHSGWSIVGIERPREP
jgi:hypothetical protein